MHNPRMPLIYVTGISGSGKSAVLRELRARGYLAYGVDEDEYGKWVNLRSGEEEPFPYESDLDIHEWYTDHLWTLDIGKITSLRERSDNDDSLVFLCGVAAGDAEAWEYFDVVCALVVNEATIRERVEMRLDDFGKSPEELSQILAWNIGFEAAYRGFGAVIIDAEQPLSAVVDGILLAAESAGTRSE